MRSNSYSPLADLSPPQVTDTNYGWDSFISIFITHYPGLYFFTFSVKADGDGDNFKYEYGKRQ